MREKADGQGPGSAPDHGDSGPTALRWVRSGRGTWIPGLALALVIAGRPRPWANGSRSSAVR